MEREYVSTTDLKFTSIIADLLPPFLVTAVAFLESMGLPHPMLTVTRKQVEQGKLDLTTSLEYRMYSRHDKPVEE